ncbi:RluA family pseudouridine synthase [Candidatus Peregrinibacteria bacterium]|nr:RluA family pseudouridine synthase [Candidatus Peregrinibacteria bacterium]
MPKRDLIPVIYEDEYLLAVNKPAGIPSVPDPKTKLPRTVMGMAREKFKGGEFTPYLLHRLDAQTSGLILFGKYAKDRKPLEAIFKAPDTHKKYLAMLKGVPHGEKLTFPVPARESKILVPAETRFKVIYTFDLFKQVCSIVEAEIRTGRRHQIRLHFAKIKCPVINDSVYGDLKFNKKFRTTFQFGRLVLHSRSLSFRHPLTGKSVAVEAPLPPDLQSLMKKIFGRKILF